MDLIDTFFNLRVLRDTLPLLLEGLWVTVLLGAASIVLGFVSGLAMALLRLFAWAPLRAVARIYIDGRGVETSRLTTRLSLSSVSARYAGSLPVQAL